VLTNLVQIWLKKLGGADVQINDLGPVTKLGAGRRTGALRCAAHRQGCPTRRPAPQPVPRACPLASGVYT
jgi:hypothetical protein